MNTCSIFRNFAAISTVCVLSGSVVAQDPEGPVGAIQQSLKRQQYYSGEVTGKYDEATRGAVRRFQIRQGLKVSGELDAATLETLAAAEKTAPVEGNPNPPAVQEPVQEPVPARERTRQLAQGDQEFLAQIEGDEEPPPIAPPAEPERRQPAPPPRPDRQPERPPVPQIETPAERQDAPPPPEPRRPAREEVDSAPPKAEPRAGISPAEAREFVRSYLEAAEGATPEREVSFYDDRVNYFGDGRINKQAIEKDQRAYYRKWPKRDFDLLEEPEVIKASGDEATVRFRIRYDVRKGDENARGRTENVVRLRRSGDGMKIIAIRERKLD